MMLARLLPKSLPLLGEKMAVDEPSELSMENVLTMLMLVCSWEMADSIW